MLSHQVLTRQDIGDVASYYGDAADDYYAKEGEAQVWQGKGAEKLGLVGEVDRDRFRDLLAGRIDPEGPSVRQGTRDDAKSRIGIDLTFSAPKSVSIHALVGGNAAMIAAHDKAVAAALQAAEAMAQARTKVSGRSRLETTGNLVIAKFRHETTRAQDPELHTHAVVMNLTQRADGQWRALKNDEIIQATKYLGAVYRSELAAELQRQGHELRMGREGMFELASMSREQIMAFSQRSQQIEAALAAKGLTREEATTSQLQQATMQTRDRKEANVDRAAMYAEWQERARQLGIELADPRLGASASRMTDEQIAEGQAAAASQAVAYAIAHISERDAILANGAIIDVAMKHAVGRTTLGAIHVAVVRAVEGGALLQEAQLYKMAGAVGGAQLTAAEWAKAVESAGLSPATAQARVEAAMANGGLVPAEPRYTTPDALARELQVLAIEKQGRGAVTPIMSVEQAVAHFAKEPLNEGQRQSATQILSTSNRVVGIEGFAGAGKSHMLNKAKDRIEGVRAALPLLPGYNFQALAPYGAQVKALQELGVEARTVAAFLRAADKKIDDKTVLVIDEAGTVPARQMADILSVAEKAGARVVLVGDRAQTKAIEAGRPFDQLIRNGMDVAKLTEIQRQKDPVLKEAVELAAVGKVRASLEKIAHVQEIQNDAQRRTTLARDYVALAPKERDDTIIVTGTNEARRDINKLIRDALHLAGNGRAYELLLRRDTTQAERGFAHNYNIGDTVQPERSGLGLSRHETYRVVENGPHNQLTVVDKDGQQRSFDPSRLPLSVYETRKDELTVGDVVRITRNDAAKDLANGDRFKVARAMPDSITLSNGKRDVTLAADKPLHVDHAYVTTVHSSQGLTVGRVMYDVMTRSKTVARDIWYVAISRARHEARIYTNSVKDLPRAISRVNEKGAALDLHRNTEIIREKQAQTAARQFNATAPQAQRSKDFEKQQAKGLEKGKHLMSAALIVPGAAAARPLPGLLSPSYAYKPFRYPWAYDYWKKQQQVHWMAEEIPLGEDLKDWASNLNDRERNLLTQIFRFFTQSDVEVNDNYMERYSRVFKPTEVKMMLAAFSNMETVHIAAYALLLETIGMPDSEFTAFLDYQAMRDKHDYMQKFGVESDADIARTLAMFGGFTEGLQLFASFAMLMNFPRHGKMKGMGQIVSWSVRDESLHCEAIIKLFHAFNQETGAVTPAVADDIVDCCKTVVTLEDKFIDLAFEAGEIQGMTPADIKAYIRFIADWRLKQLALPQVYEVKENPLSWLQSMLSGVEHANFFEARSTEYSKAATKGKWEGDEGVWSVFDAHLSRVRANASAEEPRS